MGYTLKLISEHIDHDTDYLIEQDENGKDYMGWHSDDEPELGVDPVIASLSLGGSRRFLFKHRRHKPTSTHAFTLEHGSLLPDQAVVTLQHERLNCLAFTARGHLKPTLPPPAQVGFTFVGGRPPDVVAERAFEHDRAVPLLAISGPRGVAQMAVQCVFGTGRG